MFDFCGHLLLSFAYLLPQNGSIKQRYEKWVLNLPLNFDTCGQEMGVKKSFKEDQGDRYEQYNPV